MNPTPPKRRDSIVAHVVRSILFFARAALGVSAAVANPLDVEIDHPWCAASPKGAVTGACYMTVRNLGTTPIRIVGVDIAVCNQTELHETEIGDGIMKMRPLPRGVEIPAKTSVDFHAHGYHLMLLDLKSSLELGQAIEGSLRFESGGSKKIEFRVETRRL